MITAKAFEALDHAAQLLAEITNLFQVDIIKIQVSGKLSQLITVELRFKGKIFALKFDLGISITIDTNPIAAIINQLKHELKKVFCGVVEHNEKAIESMKEYFE